MSLIQLDEIFVHQKFEGFELLGFETRNKYEILNSNNQPIGYAAEQKQGFWGGFVARQFLGHWRIFDVKFFDSQRQEVMLAHHPFRFYFERLEIQKPDGTPLGALQRRFSIFTKKFDLEDAHGNVVLEMRSPIWKMWTFPFYSKGNEVARIEKKWSGLLTELFTDKDIFRIVFVQNSLSDAVRWVILAAAVFVDLRFFETKANNN